MVWLKLGVFTAGTALLAVLAFVAIDRGKWLARQVDDMLVPCLHGADYDDGCQCIGPLIGCGAEVLHRRDRVAQS